MIFTYKYFVTSHKIIPFPCYDHGNWSGHSSKKEALECAKQVGGHAYKVKSKSDGTIKIKELN